MKNEKPEEKTGSLHLEMIYENATHRHHLGLSLNSVHLGDTIPFEIKTAKEFFLSNHLFCIAMDTKATRLRIHLKMFHVAGACLVTLAFYSLGLSLVVDQGT